MEIFTEYIRKTQHKIALRPEEITSLIQRYTKDEVPDYQMSAWLMAAYINGLTNDETFALASAIRNSGKSLDWNEIGLGVPFNEIADKHSTGGVGDKVSLVLVPLAIHFGLKTPMMSGRSLGHTGGTVDKLQSIPGFNLFLDEKEMLRILQSLGACMICQTEDLCPADKRIYALRDVTSTVDNVPLITASIVSKKWAEGVGSIVYDVKFGCGAFMDTLERARELAASLVQVSKKVGMNAAAMITRMEEPLGAMIGNSLEVEESCWILSNQYPDEKSRQLCEPLAKLCCQLSAKMACLAGTRKDWKAATQEALDFLNSGEAYKLFDSLCREQNAPENWRSQLEVAPVKQNYCAKQDGFLHSINSREIGLAGVEIKVGRKQKEDVIDHAVGFRMLVGRGQKVSKGDPLVELHLRSADQAKLIEKRLDAAFEISNEESLAKMDLLEETLDL